MSGYNEHLTQDRRLVLLRLIKEAQGSANESILHGYLKNLGHRRVAKRVVRDDLDWLRERGLVTHDWFDDTVLVVSITQRGLDVAEGSDTVEGVRKPSVAR